MKVITPYHSSAFIYLFLATTYLINEREIYHLYDIFENLVEYYKYMLLTNENKNMTLTTFFFGLANGARTQEPT